MRTGEALLCAVDTDGRAATLVAATRRLAGLTGLRPLFVHACAARDTSGGRAAAFHRHGIGAGELRIDVGDPQATVLAWAHRTEPALAIVAAGSGDRVAGAALGAVPATLVRDAPCPVVVLPAGAGAWFPGGPVVCAMSVDERDEDAVRFAGALARLTDRRLVLAHAMGPRDAALLAAEQTFVQAVAADARASGADRAARPAADARAGAVAGRLATLARDAAADVLVVASRRHGASAEALVGSAASALWSRARCPVAVVPE
jgi:nucleotide-binding universal stress UspA family protein